MDNLLVKTLIHSFESAEKPGTPKEGSKPFITISREFGCQANLLSEYLIAETARRGHHWKMINKEILNTTAHELKLHPDKIREVISNEKRTPIDEILDATSVKYYKSDRKIRQTIASIVTSFASQGNIIIVGRAGAAITQGFPDSLHIRLTAPALWRLESVMQRYGLNREEALKQIAATDLKRYKLQREYIKGTVAFENLFDVSFNCSKLSHKEVANMILLLMEERGMI